MQRLENILIESQLFFDKYKEEYPLALSIYNKITHIINSALQQDDYALLLSQRSYMETNEGYLAFQYIGEARQLLRILNIIALEEKYRTVPFSHATKTTQELIEKYKFSLFALRRIVFSLSSESIAEAEHFLEQSQLSPFAIYILAKDELIIPDKLFFQKIQEIYHSQWNTGEMQLFQELTGTI